MSKFDPPRNAKPGKPVALHAPGVLMPLGLEGRDRDDATFYTADYAVPVTCTLQPPADLAGRIWRAHVQLRDEPNGLLSVASARRDDTLDPLSLIPLNACRLPGVVAEFLELVASIQTPLLRNVVRDAFEMSDIFDNFWSAPAAPDHHHWKGGLAYHSLEVARALNDALDHQSDGDTSLTAIERDLVLVAALLHDLAECVDRGQPSTPDVEARRQACGMRRPDLVKPALENLYRGDKELGRVLLGLWCPTLEARTAAFRVAELRKVLLACHRASETSTVRPMPGFYAVLFDRLAGVRKH